MTFLPSIDGGQRSPRAGARPAPVTGHHAARAPIVHVTLPVNPVNTAGEPPRLLVVDDQLQIRALAKAMGRHLGYVVLEAASAAEALDQLRRSGGGIDVMVTDIVMPGMDGVELVREARKLPLPPGIAVMSGRYDDHLRESLAAEGVTDLLDKPFSIESLGRACTRLLAGRV